MMIRKGLRNRGKVAKSEGTNIVDVLVNNIDRFSILFTAIRAAELVETFIGEGPFTVFAPDNDAFAQLPEGTVESLLEPENIEELKNILKYHVVTGRLAVDDIVDRLNTDGPFELTTLNGQNIEIIRDENNDIYVNNSKVTETDLVASNGIIHVINKVLTPPESEE